MKSSRLVLMGLIGFLIGCFTGPYHKQKGEWYWKDQPMREVSSGASLKALSGQFATAGTQAFFRAHAISGADGRSFVALGDHYARDANSVYYCDDFRDGKEYFMIKRDRVTRIADADAKTFHVFDDYYARDATHVYFNGVPFDVADVASFQPIDYLFGRDKTTGYYAQHPVTESDGPTFAAIDGHYSRDGKHVFYSAAHVQDGVVAAVMTRTLADATVPSFVSLGQDYGTDSTRLYFQGKIMAGAAPPLELLDFFYSRTSTTVYYMGEPLAGADAASFKVTAGDGYTALDANAKYNEGRRLKGSAKR